MCPCTLPVACCSGMMPDFVFRCPALPPHSSHPFARTHQHLHISSPDTACSEQCQLLIPASSKALPHHHHYPPPYRACAMTPPAPSHIPAWSSVLWMIDAQYWCTKFDYQALKHRHIARTQTSLCIFARSLLLRVGAPAVLLPPPSSKALCSRQWAHSTDAPVSNHSALKHNHVEPFTCSLLFCVVVPPVSLFPPSPGAAC